MEKSGLAVNKAVSLALLVGTSAAVYTAIAEAPSDPASHRVSAAAASPEFFRVASTTQSEGKRWREAQARPESTTVIVHSRPMGTVVRPQPSFAGDPDRLVRELQRELRRVGCYYQEIDGDWGPATRQAMKDFIDRANAVLPLDKPDPILLTLLQSQRTVTCGNTCPAGQSLKDNRCLPTGLLRSAPLQATAQSALVRTATKVTSTETDAAPPAPAAAPAAPVRQVRRVRHRPSNFGFLGLFGW